jgi:hypothetical protein
MQTNTISPEVIDVVCQGTPRRMGREQGAGLRERIGGAHAILEKLETFRLQQPRWLPYRLYRWLSERKARRLLCEPLAQDYPALGERLAGLAEGAGLCLPSAALLNAMEPLLSSLGGCTACPGACSAVAVRGRRSATAEPMIAHNFDYLPLAQPFYVIRASRPAGKRRALEFTLAPLVGAVDGMNDAGLCITYNYAYTTDTPPRPAAPTSFAITAALESCATVAEAAEFITARPRWGGAMLLLADASGDIATLELSSTRSHLRRPAAGEDALCHTNALSAGPLREVEIPGDAVYTCRAPTPLRGRRVRRASELRGQRFEQLLHETDVLTADDLAALMADHGPDGTPADCTPCVHGAYWNTTACLQFFPHSRRMRVSFSSACRASYQEVEV